MKNYAFIDSQNLYRGLQALGWSVDFKKFRNYLSDKYSVSKAYWFVGYIAENRWFYQALKKAGFVVIFKEVSWNLSGEPKGNIDVHLTLYTMDQINLYNQAIIITSDGDFGVLVEYLKKRDKLKAIISPAKNSTSFLLRKAVGRDKSVQYLDALKHKISK